MNFEPWSQIGPNYPYQKDLGNKALDNLSRVPESQVSTIRLKEDELLIIDGDRFIHSRNKVADTKLTMLKKLWLKAFN